MSTTIDRRELIIGAGATMAAACLPVALAVAAPAAGGESPQATLADWHVDDMWGVYPRPHEPIACGRPRDEAPPAAAVHPADLQFLT